MTGIFWFVVCLFVVVAGGIPWYIRRKFKERQRAEEERIASFLAASAGKAKPAEPPPSPAAVASAGDGLAQQRLLFEAAHKAGEAGEPALAIQLYARLLARYPATAFAAQAHAAVDATKKKFAKG